MSNIQCPIYHVQYTKISIIVYIRHKKLIALRNILFLTQIKIKLSSNSKIKSNPYSKSHPNSKSHPLTVNMALLGKILFVFKEEFNADYNNIGISSTELEEFSDLNEESLTKLFNILEEKDIFTKTELNTIKK